jgi:methionyl-tRNA formyltransferase
MEETVTDPNGTASGPRVLFLGMQGAFSYIPLLTLLAAGVEVAAVLIPADGPAVDASAEAPIWQEPPRSPPRASRSTLPVLTPYHEPSIVSLAWEWQIPLLVVARERDARTLAALAACAPDAICLACWPRRVPDALLSLGHLGWLNVHPSLLPLHRGPVPLFWTLRHGDAQAGVTVHLMDATLDGGDILAQEPVPIPDGISGDELERRCAEVGGRLLVASVRALASGRAERELQPTGAGSYEPAPTPADYLVTSDRPARWAFNFIRGAAHWGGPSVVEVAGRRFAVRAALDYTPVGALEATYRVDGHTLWLQCAPGILRVALE